MMATRDFSLRRRGAVAVRTMWRILGCRGVGQPVVCHKTRRSVLFD
jgi:hypothetical protein